MHYGRAVAISDCDWKTLKTFPSRQKLIHTLPNWTLFHQKCNKITKKKKCFERDNEILIKDAIYTDGDGIIVTHCIGGFKKPQVASQQYNRATPKISTY